MGCAGNYDIETPNLDRIAANGVRFENFFCASPVCSPARASILTGMIPSAHGVQDWNRSDNLDRELLGEKKDDPYYVICGNMPGQKSPLRLHSIPSEASSAPPRSHRAP